MTCHHDVSSRGVIMTYHHGVFACKWFYVLVTASRYGHVRWVDVIKSSKHNQPHLPKVL